MNEVYNFSFVLFDWVTFSKICVWPRTEELKLNSVSAIQGNLAREQILILAFSVF